MTQMGQRAFLVGALSFVLALSLQCGAADFARAEPPQAAAQGSPPSDACNRPGFRVLVDVGHTAKVPGALGARGVREYEFNLKLAKLISEKLTEAGFLRTTLLITDGPAHKSLVQRVARANHASADLFLSIHHDSVPDSFLEKWEFAGMKLSFSDRFRGHSIFVSNQNGDFRGSVQFGSLLGKQLKARGMVYAHHYTEKFMGRRQRVLVDAENGVYRYDKLIVLKDTRMPAVLLEAGSIINRSEEQLMGSPEHQLLIAAAVLDSVEDFCATRQQASTMTAARHPAPSTTTRATLLPAWFSRSGSRAKGQ